MNAALVGWAAVGVSALGGGVGAALRYAVDQAVTSRWRRPFPLGTLVVNVTGSLLLGVLVGAGMATGSAAGSPALATLLGAGLLGGYTTFSTASHDAIRLARADGRGSALAYATGTMLATVAAALLGLWLGIWLRLWFGGGSAG